MLHKVSVPSVGYFVAPTVIKVAGISDLEREVFGPVLHMATFSAGDIDQVIDEVNACGYGLTFGLHTRINERVERVRSRVQVGNLYVNRNQIGAIVGSQPFGGEGMSGTGPKAGGPHYLGRFFKEVSVTAHSDAARPLSFEKVQAAIKAKPKSTGAVLSTVKLPGPTGERNELSTYARGLVLCLGPTPEFAQEQSRLAASQGCEVLMIASNLAKGEGLMERSTVQLLRS